MESYLLIACASLAVSGLVLRIPLECLGNLRIKVISRVWDLASQNCKPVALPPCSPLGLIIATFNFVRIVSLFQKL